MSSLAVVDRADGDMEVTEGEFSSLVLAVYPGAAVSGSTAKVQRPEDERFWQVFRLSSTIASDGTLEQFLPVVQHLVQHLQRPLTILNTRNEELTDVALL